jgi:quinolinate synthase
MAEMVPTLLAEQVLGALNRDGARIIPLTYVNSSAAVKAVCGRHGGSVCTSANSATMMRWALDQGDGVLFLPDANLGRNTARTLGIDPSRIERLDVRGQGRFVPAADPSKDVYLWPGLCAVHAKFHTDRIEAVRRDEPDALVLVHPECHPDVVAMADGAGSTSYLIKAVANAAAGSVIYVGTEWNLVERLAKRHTDKTVRPLRTAMCSNMAKITEENLSRTLSDLNADKPVLVDEDIATPARLALERMLEACR